MTEENKDHVQTTIETYDKIAKDYHVKNNPQIRAECEASMRRFKILCLSFKAMLPPASVLVVGCGEGQDSRYMSKDLGMDVVSIDASSGMLTIAEKAHPEGVYIQMDIRDMGEDRPPTEFDGIYAQNCLYHLKESEFKKFLIDAAALLTESGILYLTMKTADSFEEKMIPAPADFPHLEGERFYTIYPVERLTMHLSEYFEFIESRIIEPPKLEKIIEMYWRKK